MYMNIYVNIFIMDQITLLHKNLAHIWVTFKWYGHNILMDRHTIYIEIELKTYLGNWEILSGVLPFKEKWHLCNSQDLALVMK